MKDAQEETKARLIQGYDIRELLVGTQLEACRILQVLKSNPCSSTMLPTLISVNNHPPLKG